jgi:LPXTG-site transpeptidase (sortase) family protein
MVINPLFPGDDDEAQKPKEADGYVFQKRHGRTINPVSSHLTHPHTRSEPTTGGTVIGDAAVDLIRRKLDAIYGDEPSAEAELAKVAKPQPEMQRSKHQKYMYELSTSGKSLAQIQTEWHAYYLSLPDTEKHEVWQEFYANNSRQPSAYTAYAQQAAAAPRPAMPGFTDEAPNANRSHHKAVVAEHSKPLPEMPHSHRKKAVAHLKKKVVNRVLTSASAQEKAKQHLHSLAFGLGTGLLVLLVFLFGFFNEMFIAPFIQPSRTVSATPIIINSDSVAPSETPEVIIPKINVQIPVVYDEPSVQEAAVQRALEDGVIHYATTVNPGQQGNAAIFGHSSNNIFNKGEYKFAFVLLHELIPGDIFYLTYDKKVYTYRVFDKKIVAPSEVSVINSVTGKPATATLITCDPPGTSTNRLVVWGEQISPDPSGAALPTVPPVETSTPTALPSEGPTLWSRFWGWVF